MTRADILDPQTYGAVAFIACVATMLSSIELVDILARGLQSWLPMPYSVYSLRFNHILWVIPALALLALVREFRWSGIGWGLFAALLCYVVLGHSRGIWVWSGTFDDIDDSSARWKGVLAWSFLIATVVSCLVSFKGGRLESCSLIGARRWAKWSLVSLYSLIGISVLMHLSADLDSAFPPLRPVYVGILALVLTGGTIVLGSGQEVSG